MNKKFRAEEIVYYSRGIAEKTNAKIIAILKL